MYGIKVECNDGSGSGRDWKDPDHRTQGSVGK